MFKEYRIFEIGEVVGGGTPSTNNPDYWNGSIPWITPNDLTGYSSVYISNGKNYITELGLRSGIKLLPAGALLFTSRAPIGYIAIANNPICTNQGFKSIICNDKCNNLYLYYYLKQNLPYIKLFGTGATFPEISGNVMKKIKINIIADIKYQKSIATILSVYDDLIENNNKRIRILENLVKDWYQHNFSTEKIKSCSNLIKLGEVIQIIRGVSYSSEEIDCEDGNDLINLKNIQAFGGFRLDGTKKYNGKYKKEQIVKTGDLIMGVTDMTQDRRTVGSVALIPITQNTSVISADLIKIQSNLDSVFLYAMFRYGNISKYISQFANGANVLHLRPQAILNIKVFLPEEKKIMDFAQKVKPILDEINILNEKNANLAKQRDLLLPRLMSGKLEIKGTDDA